MEKLVETMIQRNVAGFCLQETWRLGNFITTIRGNTVIHHGMEKKNNLKVIISAGVAVILNPVLTKAWSRSGKLPPITSDNSLNFSGRMIGVTVCFPCRWNRPKDAYIRESNKSIKIFICSIYHPVEHDEQKLFNNELDTFYTNAPRNSEILAGQDINANAGIFSPMFNDVLRPNGIRNINAKGIYLLFLIKSQKLKFLLS